MKKIYYLMAMAMMAFTFTSCEDVPEPFGQPINPNQSEETIDPAGDGTAASPYNVAAVLDYLNTLGADVTSPNDVYVSMAMPPSKWPTQKPARRPLPSIAVCIWAT